MRILIVRASMDACRGESRRFGGAISHTIRQPQWHSDYSYTNRAGGERWTCTNHMSREIGTAYKVENSWPCVEDQ